MHKIFIAFMSLLGGATAVLFPYACNQWHSNGTFLIAVCSHNTFGTRLSALDLNFCFLNDRGVVKPLARGFFAKSCELTDMQTEETSLQAECKSGDLTRPIIHNDISLKDVVNVDQGLLNCNGINGCDVGTGSCLGCDWTELHDDRGYC